MERGRGRIFFVKLYPTIGNACCGSPVDEDVSSFDRNNVVYVATSLSLSRYPIWASISSFSTAEKLYVCPFCVHHAAIWCFFSKIQKETYVRSGRAIIDAALVRASSAGIYKQTNKKRLPAPNIT